MDAPDVNESGESSKVALKLEDSLLLSGFGV
jgi:hypothetical protein